ncbi:hypothetical protein HNY73_008979 [Argiope bruennichi]|uniref:Uncharacterized protein n=1 Tax=Argiope bruennichi TaxID=94029 RepID=A0A8T0F839_ARGBR|nr:hypothetical protein HNY73_008979 [Argiope bruennichi]
MKNIIFAIVFTVILASTNAAPTTTLEPGVQGRHGLGILGLGMGIGGHIGVGGNVGMGVGGYGYPGVANVGHGRIRTGRLWSLQPRTCWSIFRNL